VLGVCVSAVVVTACNQIFDLKPTQSVDAAHEFFDAPIDAPFACPPLGASPQFGSVFHQVVLQNCKDYTISAERQVAMALCDPGNGEYRYDLTQGPIDGPLAIVPGFADPAWDLQFMRLSPDGDKLFLLYYSTTLFMYQIRAFHFDGAAWQRDPDLAMLSSYAEFSAATAKPNRRAMLTDTSSRLAELVEDDTGKWVVAAVHPPAELGLGVAGAPKLSADGLRILVTGVVASGGGEHVYYSARASVVDPFPPATQLLGVPNVRDAYMTEDCGRVYFSGLESIFYVQRL
jgi:hypothetical protein